MEKPKVIRRRANRSEAGTTLVELMIAMVISTIVVFFLFTIQSRMSRAYRGQGTVSEVVQNLQAARQLLVRDIRMAGYGLATGSIEVAPTVDATETLLGLSVTNDAYGDGNDTFRLLYSDTIDNIRIDTKPGVNFNDVFIDYLPASAALGLSVGQTIVLRAPNSSCLLAISGFTGTNKLHILSTADTIPYNTSGPAANDHCNLVQIEAAAGNTVTIQRLVSRSYRIDPTRPAGGFLQMSPSGEVVANDWIDQGVGFTNLQIATRYFETGDLVDLDGDGDPERDWYSSDNQDTPDLTGDRPANAVLIQASIAIEGRGVFGNKSAIPTIATPAFTDLTNVDNNPLGDWGQACPGAPQDPCGIHLAVTPDASRPLRYEGEHIYRYVKANIDLRNIGVGQ